MAMQQTMYQKPQVSIWDGIVMGGGVGISIHGTYRIATENTLFAMPETGIGLFPDVGATYWLSRLELSDQFRGVGMFLALTGWRLRPEDLIFTRIATHYVHSTKLADLKRQLIQRVKTSDDVKVILDEFHQLPEEDLQTLVQKRKKPDYNENENSFLETNLDQIQSFFSNASVSEIMKNLSTSDSSFAQTILSHLRKMSPTSLVVTAEGIKRAAQMDHIRDVLVMEYRMAQGFMRHCGPPNLLQNTKVSVDSDFYEGIRALLIDKDRRPKWNPKTVDEIDMQQIHDRYFKEGALEEELTFNTTSDSNKSTSKL